MCGGGGARGPLGYTPLDVGCARGACVPVAAQITMTFQHYNQPEEMDSFLQVPVSDRHLPLIAPLAMAQTDLCPFAIALLCVLLRERML